MADLTPAANEWLRDHHGVISAGQLRTKGVGRATTHRLVANGVLLARGKGVYSLASAPRTLEQRCVEVTLAHRGSFVTGPTAGGLAGLRRMPRTSALHVAVRHGVHLPAVTGVRWRQTTANTSADRSARDDGIVVASWPRLAFDLAADLAQLDHRSVVEQLLHDDRVTVEELVAFDARLGHPARPGSGVFRRTLTSLGGQSDSHPEVVLVDELQRRGVPVEAQCPVVRPADGRTFHVDLGVPSIRWGVELDIHPEHRTTEGHASDAERRREMHRQGWQIEVVTELDMHRPQQIARELAGLYRRRCQLVGPGADRPNAS
jgi:hypothetical protein